MIFQTNQDIIFCILPKIQPDAPTVGPAVLKSHCIAAGFSASLVDLNIDLYKCLGESNKHYWFESDDVFYKESKWKSFYPLIKERVEFYALEICKAAPRYAGLSVFSNRSALFAFKLIEEIKKINPYQKVVVGGAGIFHRTDLKENLVDHYIKGDGEFGIVELLRGNTNFPGIDSNEGYQIDNIDSVLYPNYDDIVWNQYGEDTDDYTTAFITGSRGCVRSCTFCDVASMWPKYRFRSGKNIAGEIIEIRKKYSITSFEFTDSLINGSMKAFRDMCKTLADYRSETRDNNWGWQSQFIARSKTQMPPEDFTLMKKGGGNMVSIGIESASESVRTHMKKGFSNEDMWYTYEQCKNNNIKMGLMMLVGYPTETKEDFQETLLMLEQLKARGYFEINPANGFKYVRRISFGPTMQIYEGMPLNTMSIDLHEDASNNWVHKNNNIRVRIVRLLQAYAKLEELGYDETWWMINRRNKNLQDEYESITGKKLPDNILNYDEENEY